jgi:hypothetical protein
MKTFPGFEHLYDLADPLSRRFVRGELLNTDRADDSVVVKFPNKGALDAIVWTDSVTTVLFSDALIEQLSNAGVSGWKMSAVHLAPGSREPQTSFKRFIVIGKCGPIDFLRAELVNRDDRPGKLYRGLFFDEGSWDGSDCVSPPGAALRFVTERVNDVVGRLAKNCRLTRLSNATTSELVVRSTQR